MFEANNKAVDYLYRALCQSEFDQVQIRDLACMIGLELKMLMLVMRMFRHGCMRLTRESMRISLISPVSL
jgi:hypothetical protein